MEAAHRLLETAARRFDEAAKARQTDTSTAPLTRVITISRQLGSGGRNLAEKVSQRLGLPLWDREILDVLAAQSGRPFPARLFDALDETAQSEIDSVVLGLISPVSGHTYEYLLRKAIQVISQHDAIILGRGAHLVLPSSLRVRLVAPMALRTRRLMVLESLDETAAHQRLTRSDRERDAFVRSFRRRLHLDQHVSGPEDEYDLTINTGRLDIDAATDLVQRAATALFEGQAQSLASEHPSIRTAA